MAMRVAILVAILETAQCFVPSPAHRQPWRLRSSQIPEDHETPPPSNTPDPISLPVYLFGKSGEFSQDLELLGVSPRRFFLQILVVAPSISLLGNLFGCTSTVLGLLPPTLVESSKLDTYYPIRNPVDGTMTKRYVASDGTYDFKLPASWLEDQAVVLAKARRFEGQQAFVGDGTQWPEPKRGTSRSSTIPDAAFGPAERSRGDGTENVSVVRSKLLPGFTLRGTLGEPATAAKALLANVIAAPGSGRSAELLNAGEEIRGSRQASNGGLVYTFEYVLTRPDGKKVHNLSVISALDNELFTLTALCPESEFARKEMLLRSIAASFRIL